MEKMRWVKVKLGNPAERKFIFLKEKVSAYPVIDIIPGENFGWGLLSIDVEIRINVYLFNGPRPIAAVLMDGKQNPADPPVA
jgi:hypothetical protein